MKHHGRGTSTDDIETAGPPRRQESVTAPPTGSVRERSDRTAPVPGSGSDLPCQNSHKCIGTPRESHRPGASPFEPAPVQTVEQWAEKRAKFPASARRTAFALQLNVQALCEAHGIDRVGFLTLTFADPITDPREAQRRMHSLTTNVLKPRYGRSVRVIERQKSGRLHYHLLVACPADIRTGLDFAALKRGDYRTANQALRAEWAFLRATAKRYGFGRTELLPIKSTVEAIGKYAGKYIAKHIEVRKSADRGIRLVSTIGERVASTKFAWAGGKAALWRAKLAQFVAMLHDAGAIRSPTVEAMALRFGPRWAHYWRDSICTFPAVDADGVLLDQSSRTVTSHTPVTSPPPWTTMLPATTVDDTCGSEGADAP